MKHTAPLHAFGLAERYVHTYPAATHASVFRFVRTFFETAERPFGDAEKAAIWAAYRRFSPRYRHREPFHA